MLRNTEVMDNQEERRAHGAMKVSAIGQLLRETEKAILLKTADAGNIYRRQEAWLPKSQIETEKIFIDEDTAVFFRESELTGDEKIAAYINDAVMVEVRLPMWLAREKYLRTTRLTEKDKE